MEKPLVSVITPTFNRKQFLGEAIDSVISQTYSNWEYIIVDDGSNDGTDALVQQYLRDGRVSYVYQQNAGHASAKNTGIRQASGEYVCFLDSDNVWLPTKLQDQVSIMQQNPSVDTLYSDILTINKQGEVISEKNMPRFSGNLTKQLLRDNCVSINTSMSRMEVIKRINLFDEDLRRGDDYDFWLRLSTIATFHYEPTIWVKYRVMKEQISTDKEGRFLANLDMIKRFFEKFPDQDVGATKRHAISYLFGRRARYRSANGKRIYAMVDAVRSVCLAPSKSWGWRVVLKAMLP